MAHLQNLNEAGVALQGYDPVSYFSGQPTQGKAEISTTFEGAIYHFSNETNKTTFEATPEQYKPQYGGFCAVAVSEGKTFPINPNTYRIADGKLYLFYNGKLGNTKLQWDADMQTRQRNADTHWQNDDLVVVYPTVDY